MQYDTLRPFPDYCRLTNEKHECMSAMWKTKMVLPSDLHCPYNICMYPLFNLINTDRQKIECNIQKYIKSLTMFQKL